jgi:hypothetical protein
MCLIKQSIIYTYSIGNQMKSDKRKPKRNLFAALAWNRRSGSHDKPYKSKRGKLNRDLGV